jgi:dissimilatory sulfite reductase (desulfoviridin) alpha/beta subunit
MVSEDEILPILEKTLLWFRENGYQKERLGMTIDRVGAIALERALFSNDLLERREVILDREIMQRP